MKQSDVVLRKGSVCEECVALRFRRLEWSSRSLSLHQPEWLGSRLTLDMNQRPRRACYGESFASETMPSSSLHDSPSVCAAAVPHFARSSSLIYGTLGTASRQDMQKKSFKAHRAFIVDSECEKVFLQALSLLTSLLNSSSQANLMLCMFNSHLVRRERAKLPPSFLLLILLPLRLVIIHFPVSRICLRHSEREEWKKFVSHGESFFFLFMVTLYTASCSFFQKNFSSWK